MDISRVRKLLLAGEDSRTQFKENLKNSDQLAQEMIAFSNSAGGTIIIGVSDDGEIKGLSTEDIGRLDQLISNSASENVKLPIFPQTQTLAIDGKTILLVHVPFGYNKPYCTYKGVYLTKSGADKRKVSQDELRRLFQESGKLYADETLFKNARFEDIDLDAFQRFHQKKYGTPYEDGLNGLPRVFENLNLATENHLNLSGLLLFCRNPMKYTPLAQMICVSFLGNDIAGMEYRDSENIEGNITALFTRGLAFLKRNLKRIQNGQGFNSTGVLEINSDVLEELLVNALIHRDYFISNNIQVLIFDDRIEILNPGKLPNSLTVDKIKRGISMKRNQTLASFASDLIPYRGIGSGILRILKLYPDIEFINDVENGQFKAIIKRPINP